MYISKSVLSEKHCKVAMLFTGMRIAAKIFLPHVAQAMA